MTMRERMARALFAAVIRSPEARAIQPWEAKSERDQQDYYLMADAALDALMEPSDEMIESAVNESVERVSDHLARDVVWFQHRALIRAAKEER